MIRTACPGGVLDRTSRYAVDNMVTGNLQFAIGLLKHFEVGLGLAVGPRLFNCGESARPGVAKEQQVIGCDS